MHEKTQRSTGKTSRYIEFDIGGSFMVLLIIRQLEKIEDIIVKQTNKIDREKMLDIGVKPRKKLTRKNKEKHSVAPKKRPDTLNLISVHRLLCC